MLKRISFTRLNKFEMLGFALRLAAERQERFVMAMNAKQLENELQIKMNRKMTEKKLD